MIILKYVCVKPLTLEVQNPSNLSKIDIVDVDIDSIWTLDVESENLTQDAVVRLFRVMPYGILWVDLNKQQFKQHFKIFK